MASPRGAALAPAEGGKTAPPKAPSKLRKRVAWVLRALNVLDLLGLWKWKFPEGSATLQQLFGFTTTAERVQLAIGTLCHMINGLNLPLRLFFLGGAFNLGAHPSVERLLPTIIVLCSCGVLVVICRWIAVLTFDRTKESQMAMYKSSYVTAITRQDISWFDTSKPQTLATVAGEAMVAVDNGLASKTWTMIEFRATFAGAIVIGKCCW